MSADDYLSASVNIGTPAARLYDMAPDPPFAVVEISADGHTRAIMHTPGRARAMAAAFEAAAVLLEEHAAGHGLCPGCWGLLPGHSLTCALIPAGPEHPAGAQAPPPEMIP